MKKSDKFSEDLAAWLSSSQPKTMGGMLRVLGEKSFAFLFLVLMIVPATPVPTGGIVILFEAVVILVALQLIVGRKTIWLPKKLEQMKLNPSLQKKVLPFLLKRIQFAEKHSKPRLETMLKKRWFKSQLGVVVAVLSATAIIAPPFTGLDTLPSLGVVFISIGIILGDISIIALGYGVGIIGIGLVVTLSAGIINGLLLLFR